MCSDGKSSIIGKSPLEFLNYRIVRLALECGSKMSTGDFPKNARVKVGTRCPDVIHTESNGVYIVPLGARMSIIPPDSEDLIFAVRAEIVGFFRFKNPDDTDPKLREKLILNQTPAVLMPFLRGAISSIIAISGFSAPPFPLLNMTRIAEDMERKIIEKTSDTAPAL